MKSFAHFDAYSVDEANELLREYNGEAKVIAGGTDLLNAMKDGSITKYPQAIINLKTIEGLSSIQYDDKGISIGALVRLSEIAISPAVQETYSILGEAAHSVATPGIRNIATIGGNLAQDIRCWYYRYPNQIGGAINCLRKGGKVCDAVGGDNRYHAIFGGKKCFAVNPSDIAIALVALDATVVTNSRIIPAEAFFRASATESTILDNDEIITEIKVQRPLCSTTQRYLKFTIRKPIDFAVVSAAVTITIEDGICTDSRIVLGAVDSKPFRVVMAEEFLKGKYMSEGMAEDAAEIALSGARPLAQNGYKVKIARSILKRALLGQTSG